MGGEDEMRGCREYDECFHDKYEIQILKRNFFT